MVKEIKIVSNYDDWEGLYINDVLVYQHHKIPLRVILNELNINLEELEVSHEYLGETVAELPKNIKDIPEDAFV